VGYIGHGCGRLFESKLRKLKLQTYQSISPAKVREKLPAKVQNRENGVLGEENSLHLLRMLHKREGGPHFIFIPDDRNSPNQVLDLVTSQAT